LRFVRTSRATSQVSLNFGFALLAQHRLQIHSQFVQSQMTLWRLATHARTVTQAGLKDEHFLASGCVTALAGRREGRFAIIRPSRFTSRTQ